jgi:hypothetical protein
VVETLVCRRAREATAALPSSNRRQMRTASFGSPRARTMNFKGTKNNASGITPVKVVNI